jgi:hypothetical protein
MPDETPTLMTLPQAAKAAASYLLQIYPAAQQVRVEEVELTDDDSYWMITLGFLLPDEDPNRVGIATSVALSMTGPRRIYRIFKIDRRSGEIRSMKIRELMSA